MAMRRPVQSTLKCASVVRPVRPLMGRMSWGQAENAITRSSSARRTTWLPGVEIGKEAFVAAGAVVTTDVASRAVVMGVPARQVREVQPADLLERWR